MWLRFLRKKRNYQIFFSEFVILLKLGFLWWKLKIFIANFFHVWPNRFWRIFSILLSTLPTIKGRWKNYVAITLMLNHNLTGLSARNQIKKYTPCLQSDPSVYIVLPIKDQRSADRARKDIYSLGAKIDVNVKPVFTSRKLSQTLSVKENIPPIVNTQCVVYLFQCDLCDANYVGYTAWHLHQHISEHRYSAIGNTLKHSMATAEQRLTIFSKFWGNVTASLIA